MMNNNKRINHQILDQLVSSNWGLPHIHHLPTPLAGGQEKSFAEHLIFDVSFDFPLCATRRRDIA